MVTYTNFMQPKVINYIGTTQNSYSLEIKK